MSLIRIRRERREMGGAGPKRPLSIGRLTLLLIGVGLLFWWMTQLGG